jgi:O-antigen/teichoic acid export membrane protein
MTLSATSFVEYLFFSADSFTVGKYYGDAVLGLYSRAALLGRLIICNASTAMMKVLFPAFSRVQGDTRKLASAYQQGLAILALVCLPLSAGIFVAAGEIVSVLLGPKYRGAAVFVRILTISAPFSLAASFAATICNVKNQVKARFSAQVILTIVRWGAVLCVRRTGAATIAAVAVSVQLGQYLWYQSLANAVMGLDWNRCVRASMPGIRLALAVGTFAALTGFLIPDAHLGTRLAVEITAAAATCGAYLHLAPPALLLPLMIRLIDSTPGRLRLIVDYRGRLVGRLQRSAPDEGLRAEAS